MIRHTALFTGYELKKSFSNPIWPLFGILQPVLYLVMFAPLLKTMTPGGTTVDALRLFTPAAMMMIAVFGSMFSGFGLIAELRGGSIERYAVSPAWRPAIVLGRVAKDMVQLVFQAILVLIVVTTASTMKTANAIGIEESDSCPANSARPASTAW
jgi:ABC-2 type transport system permease protein